MEFDLQRFAEDTEPETSAETSPEEQEPIPEELDGIPEDIARETMAEWEQSKVEPESAPPAESQTVSREEYEQLKAQLAEFQKQQQPAQKPPQQPQQPPFKITPEISTKINQAIKEEAMALTGFSQDDVDSLEYADDDDPRLAQWNQAKNFATSTVLETVRQGRIAQQQQQQQAQANYLAATQIYNEFAQREFKEPDFKDIQHFATNEFFEQLKPNEQRIIANSYLNIERQTATPAEMLVVKNYYEQAKAAFRRGGGRKRAPAAYQKAQQAASLPRSDMLRGNSGTRELSAVELDHMLDTMPFDQIPEAYQKILLGN